MNNTSNSSGIPPAFDETVIEGFVENEMEAMSRFRCVVSRSDGEEFMLNGLQPFTLTSGIETLTSQPIILNFEKAVIRVITNAINPNITTQVKYDNFVFPDGRSVITIYYNSKVFYRGVITDFEYGSSNLAMTVSQKTYALAQSNYKHAERDYSGYSNFYDILTVSLQKMGYIINDNEDRHKKYNHIKIIANVEDIKKIKITTKSGDGNNLEYEEDINGVRVNAKTSSTVAGIIEKVSEFLLKIANQLGMLLYTNVDGDIVVSRIDRLLEKISEDNENNLIQRTAIVSAVIPSGEPALLPEYKPNIVMDGTTALYKIRNGVTGRFAIYEGVVKVAQHNNDDEQSYGTLNVPPKIITSYDSEVSELLHITNQVTDTLNPSIALRDQQQTALALKARQNIIQATIWGLAYDSAWNSDSTDFIKANDVREVILIHPNHNDIQENYVVQQATYNVNAKQITTEVILVSPNYYLNLSFNARTRPARFRKKIRVGAVT